MFIQQNMHGYEKEIINIQKNSCFEFEIRFVDTSNHRNTTNYSVIVYLGSSWQ